MQRVGNHWERLCAAERAHGIGRGRLAHQGVECGAGEILSRRWIATACVGFDARSRQRFTVVNVRDCSAAHAPETFLEVFAKAARMPALAASIFHDRIQGLGELKRYLANKEFRSPDGLIHSSC